MNDIISDTDGRSTDSSERLFDAALAKWGYDGQLLTLAHSCSDLSSAVCRFVSHRLNGQTLAAGVAEVEIMLDQLRHSGMNDMVSQAKARLLVSLAARLMSGPAPEPAEKPCVTGLLEDAGEQLPLALALYVDSTSSERLTAARARRCIALLMQAAQIMIREAQAAERGYAK